MERALPGRAGPGLLGGLQALPAAQAEPQRRGRSGGPFPSVLYLIPWGKDRPWMAAVLWHPGFQPVSPPCNDTVPPAVPEQPSLTHHHC